MKVFSFPPPDGLSVGPATASETSAAPASELTRANFDTREAYFRWLRESGLEPLEAELWSAPSSHLDQHGALFCGVLGWSKRQNEVAWQRRGQTQTISGPNFRKAYNAVAFSNRIGAVMNVHLTIVWPTVISGGDLIFAKALRRFLELFRKWCGERELPCHWIYCWERGLRNGLHSHILAHIPHLFAYDFEKWARKALETVTGRKPALRVRRHSKSDPPHTLHIVHRRENDVRAQWHLFRYLMKGLGSWLVDDVADRRRRQPLHEIAAIKRRGQGLIVTKRVGTSRAVGEGAQRAWGFKSAFDRGAVSSPQLYSDEDFRDSCEDRERQSLHEFFKRLPL